MEDTLGERKNKLIKSFNGLNPCSNGRYSRSNHSYPMDKRIVVSLNPCSNGRYSRRVRGVKALFQAGGE